jgi:uncharacterized protein YqgV (UPF0045/DUF77 family)
MDVAVEISLYPLTEGFAPVIHEFIERLTAVDGLKVVSGSLSTQIVGEYEQVFGTLQREMRAMMAERAALSGKAVFVMKLLGPL